MHTFIARRLVLTISTLFGVALFVFVLLRVVPGDPIAMMVVPESTPQDVENLRVFYGLDRSIAEQFLIYLRNLVTGDFGTSITLRRNVLDVIMERLPATIELAVVSMIIACVCGVIFALVSVNWVGRWPEALIDTFNAIALSIPEFLWGLLLILVLGVTFHLFPISGRIDPLNAGALHTQFYLLESIVTARWELAAELLRHLTLPAIALALPLIGVIARVLKGSLMEAINQDYVMFARAKGFSKETVLVRQALPNALIPTITIAGTHFTLLVGGTVLVELIFSFPGMGNLLYGAAINRDLPLIQGITVIFSVIFILINFLVDVSYAMLNPRVKNT